MRVDFFGPDYNFFENAFFHAGALVVQAQGGATSTLVILDNPMTAVVTTVAGYGFAYDATGDVVAGTVTSLTFSQGGDVLATMSDLAWGATDLTSALIAADTGNTAPLWALLNSAPIILDASAASVPLTTGALFGFTVGTTIIGSGFGDTLSGGSGNDTIHFGNSASDFALDSAGSDTYVFTQVVDGYASLIYANSSGGLNVTIDGNFNFGQIVKVDGIDTLVDIVNPLRAGWTAGGFGLLGTDKADIFTLDGGEETWMQVAGAEGNDVFNLTLSGVIRLNFNWNAQNARIATQALDIDVSAGTVYNDGFGFSDSLNITDGAGSLQIRATRFDDTIVGSAADETFILHQGTDTVDGGGGQDKLRYDRDGVDAVTVDLATGIATGTWDGDSFTHYFTSIESLRGSRDGNDTLGGNSKDNWIQGRGGDDDISGLGGKDLLYGDEGNDTLNGGKGNDELWDGSGNDTVLGKTGNDIFYNGGGSDTFNGGKGRDTLVEDSADWPISPATVEMNMLSGVHGIFGSTMGQDKISSIENYTFTGDWDTKVTGNGVRNVIRTDRGEDWVNGNKGNDKITTGAGNDVLLGGAGKDNLNGGAGNDVIKGGAGADVLIAGKGADRLLGGAGADVFVFAGGVLEGRNTVADFDDGTDMLRITGGSFADIAIGGSATRTVIDLASGTTIILKGVDMALIGVDDFDFV